MISQASQVHASWEKWFWNNTLLDFKERIFVGKVEVVETCLKH